MSWHTQRKKWHVEIREGGTRRGLGLLDDKQDATRAWDSAARWLDASGCVPDLQYVQRRSASPWQGNSRLGMMRLAASSAQLQKVAAALPAVCRNPP